MIAKKTPKKIHLAVTLAITLVIIAAISVTALRAQSTEETLNQNLEANAKDANRLEGSWVITVSAVVPPGVPPPPPRTAYISFARGGVAILYERQAAFVNPAYGVWEHVRRNEFAFTVITDSLDAMGNFAGTVKVRNKVTLTGSDEFASVGNLEVRNPAGNVLFSGCATGIGERMKVESLPDHCDGITPPQ